MLKKRFFIPLVVMSMIFTACGGGTGSNEPSADSSQPADSTSQPADTSATSKPAESSASSSKTSAPSSTQTSQSSAPASSSSSAAPVHNHDYELVANSTVKNADDKDVYVKECKDKDDKYIGIAFDDYSEKSADFGSTSGYNNVPEDLRNESRLLAKNSTITWKFNLDKAVSGAKLAFGVVYTGSDHGTQTGSDGSTVKYSIKANSGDFVDWALGTTTYDEAGFSQTARSYFTFGTIDLVEGENTVTLRQNNAGYRLLYGGEVRIHYSGDAKPVEAPVPFEGYNVTFVTEHCKVLVYSTKAYDTETPVETNTCKAKDEEGKIVAYDPDDIELQPQVSFKVVCDEGYSVTVNNVTATPRENYKNLKQNPDSKEGQDNIFRITKVQGDLTVTIAPAQGQQAKGYKIAFVPTNCTIKVYVGPKNADGSNLDTPEDGVYYARAKDGTYEISYTTPQVNFEVVCDNGYEFNPVITDNKVDFITHPDATKDGYNKFSDKGGYYNLTKVDDDLTITITATSTGGQQIETREIDFSTKTEKHSAYNDTWAYGDATIAGGANNNGGWAFVKMGGKSATISAADHPGTWIKTDAAVAYSVASVTMKFVGKCYNQDSEKATVTVLAYSDAELTTKVAETAAQEVPAINDNNGFEELTFTFAIAPAANMFYKINFDIINTTTYNGVVALEKVTFNAAA